MGTESLQNLEPRRSLSSLASQEEWDKHSSLDGSMGWRYSESHVWNSIPSYGTLIPYRSPTHIPETMR